jgi:uncharacterized membrane protein YfcA
MFDLSLLDICLLLLCALMAGLIDSIMGGGGMIQVPALFSFLPGYPPATLMSVNKIASLVGTSGSAFQYAKANKTPWKLVLISCSAAFLASVGGAYLLTQVPNQWLRGGFTIFPAGLINF